MLRDASLVARRDLRVEWRTKVTLTQVAPFALTLVVLFAFALDPDRGLLTAATPGLFWLAVLLSTLLAVQRAVAVEAGDGVRDALRLSDLDPGGMFLGRAAALAVQLVVLQLCLGLAVVVLYSLDVTGVALLVATGVPATVGLAAAGTLYGALAGGARGRETLLPLLLLPVVAPVLLAATRASEAALSGTPGEGWPWVGMLTAFAVVYLVGGTATYGTLLEDA